MALARIKGYITETGEIRVELPDNWQPGEIEIVIPVAAENHETHATADETIADVEFEEPLQFQGKPLGEIVTGGWEHLGIEDPVEWVEEMRRKEQERRGIGRLD